MRSAILASCLRSAGLIAGAVSIAGSAEAAVTISSKATQNMACSNGVCSPTARQAVLNVSDLEGLLAAGNVTVITTGSGVEAEDIDVNAALAWSNSSALSLEAHRSIVVDAIVSITGQSGLTLDTGTTGSLSFGRKGNVTFANLSSSLSINGAAYTLAGDVKTLAADMAGNRKGDFALASSYDASGDGTYTSSPLPEFDGGLEGLGNSISNLTIIGVNVGGLFPGLDADAVVENIGLVKADVQRTASGGTLGALAGSNQGTVRGSYATGKVESAFSWTGGLIGGNDSTIIRCYAKNAVTVNGEEPIGGLGPVLN